MVGGNVFRFYRCIVIVLLLTGLGLVHCASCPPIVFNFGDSNSDTGSKAAALGYKMPQPEGRAFFGHPAGRYCDGRLIIDFLCTSLNASYLSPYLESLGSNFKNGANFAFSGSSTLPADKPFSLSYQVAQFLRFKSRSLDLIKHGIGTPINERDFTKAIYSIDIGQNDLSGAFGYFHTYDKVIANIPSFILEIKKAIQIIYHSGGRNFWVLGTGPLGCLPQKLALPRPETGSTDSHGCLILFNNAAKEFNRQLSNLCDQLNTEWKDAVIAYTDIFSIKYDLIANFASYGFAKPLMACCGNGGPPYNFDQKLMCGNPRCPVCANGSKYISWDGIHYTDAANKIVSTKILSSQYSKPRVKFGFFCRN